MRSLCILYVEHGDKTGQTKHTVQYFIARSRFVYNGSPFFVCLLFHAPTEKTSDKDVTIAGEELQNLGAVIGSALMTRILNFLKLNVLSLFRYLIPLENGVALHLPIIQGRIVQSLVEIGKIEIGNFPEKEMKM